MAWWIIRGHDGRILEQVRSDGHPCDAPEGQTPAYDVPRDRVEQVDRRGDPAVEQVVDGEWTADMERMRERRLREIDLLRAEAHRTAGGPEWLVYAYGKKAAEARAVQAGQEGETPWLAQEAASRGETLEETAARVLEAERRTDRVFAAVEAMVVKAKDDVRRANTAEEAAEAVRRVSDGTRGL